MLFYKFQIFNQLRACLNFIENNIYVMKICLCNIFLPF